MGQPNPPGDIPLFEGLGSEWNDVVGAFPEDKRAELGASLKERISGYETLKPWETFAKNGMTPDTVQQAVDVFDIINRNPREVYDTIGKALGITPQQVQQVIEEGEGDDDDDDPRDAQILQMQNQLDTLSKIQLAQHQQELSARQAAESDKALENELGALKQKHGDFDEEQVLMRMLHKGMNAEEAYADHAQYVDNIRSRRPAPTLLGGAGSIPNRSIDPVKLNSKDTRSLVAQMMEAANNQS
jgi:hypothetical protein